MGWCESVSLSITVVFAQLITCDRLGEGSSDEGPCVMSVCCRLAREFCDAAGHDVIDCLAQVQSYLHTRLMCGVVILWAINLHFLICRFQILQCCDADSVI